jgi:hypothetical protein
VEIQSLASVAFAASHLATRFTATKKNLSECCKAGFDVLEPALGKTIKVCL